MDPHPFDGINLREHPECYTIGRGEYGLFHAEPYRSELLPHWAFRTPDIAAASIEQLRTQYERYVAAEDFVGMDVARKYIQMGWTRARRYAKYPGGRKYNPDGSIKEVIEEDPEKAESARLFRVALDEVLQDVRYKQAKAVWKAAFAH